MSANPAMAPQRDFGSINPLREFVLAMTALVDVHAQDEATMLARGGEHLARLVAHDDWLPERFATPHPEHYQQYLLYCDPLERFSVGMKVPAWRASITPRRISRVRVNRSSR